MLRALLLAATLASPVAAEPCATPPYPTEIAALLDALAPAAAEFPGLLAALDDGSTEICLLPGLMTVRGFLDTDLDRIALDADLSRGGKLFVLLHELRHHEQAARGFCPDNRLGIDATARLTLAAEADAMAIAAAAAWTLKQAGDADAWRFLSEDWDRYGDIAAAFAATAAGEGRDAAIEAAFAAWFASPWRVETYWLASCLDYLDREDDGKLLRSYDGVPDGLLDALCLLPDGRPYDCEIPEIDLP